MNNKDLGVAAVAMVLVLCGFAPHGMADSLPTPANSTKDAADGGDNSAFLLSLRYTGEAWHIEGGVKDGSPYLQGVNVSLNVDLEKLGVRRGARFYIEGFYVAGDSLNDIVGGGR